MIILSVLLKDQIFGKTAINREWLLIGGIEKGVENLPDKQKMIIDLIKKYPSIAKKQMAEQANLSKKSVEYNIDKLKEMGVLQHVGPAKGGYWKIVEKDL